MRNIFTKIFCLLLVAAFSIQLSAQEKMFLVKDGKIVATYGIDEVDYITFEDNGLSTGDFDIEIVSVDYRIVEWNVYPSDPDMYYHSGVCTPESIENLYHNSVDEMAESYYNAMCFVAGMAGMDPYEFMETQALAKGDGHFGYDQIGAGSDYVIVVYGINPDGKATTNYTGLPFSTPAMDMTGLTVDFNINNDTNDIVIEYTPSDDSIRYFTEVREYDGEDFDMQDWMNTLIWRGGVAEKSPEEVVAENTYFGKQTMDYSLEPECEYVVYACSVTDDGVVNSQVSSKTFVTGRVEMSENEFELVASDISVLTANLTVRPSNSDTYSVGMLPASEFEGKTDQEVLEQYVAYNQFAVDWNTRSGEFTYEWPGLNPDTEYVFFAFGYYHNTITTEMTKINFTTLPASDPKTWEASFSDVIFGDYYGTPAARVMINVNHDDVKYLWNVVDASGTPEQIHEALLRECERAEEKGFNYVEMYSIAGSNEVTFSPGEGDDKNLKFFAVVMNPETLEFETEVFFSETFTMKDAPAGVAPNKVADTGSAEGVKEGAQSSKSLRLRKLNLK